MNLDKLHQVLQKENEPVVLMNGRREYAAVAVVIVGEDIVLEKRASSDIDPWSAQYSLPGGKFEVCDITLRNTAIRETMEETGIDLKNQEYFGFFGPDSPLNRPSMKVYTYVFRTDYEPEFEKSGEIDLVFTVPLGNFNSRDVEFNFSGIRIWGLTARIISKLCELLGSS
ncbi:MAG: CoA pyrophosphatase [Thermoplasmatales archaeon]